MAKTPQMITVRPVEGRRIMLHNNPSRVIDEERQVPSHPHYHRAIARGDLERIPEGKKKKKAPPKSGRAGEEN